MIIPSQCPRFGEKESISHVMFSCIFAKRVWKEAGLWTTIKNFLHEVAAKMLVAIRQNVPLEEFKLCTVLLWGLWWECNKYIHGGSTRDHCSQASFAKSFLEEFQEARKKQVVAIVQEPTPLAGWSPPDIGRIKINSDASFRRGDDGSNFGGIEVVF